MSGKNIPQIPPNENLQGYTTKLSAVLNTVIDGIITIDHRGVIDSFNRSAERIFQYDAIEVIGCNVKMLMPDPYHGEHDIYIENYLSTGDKNVIGAIREVQAKRKDGTVFPMELSVNEMSISGVKMFVGTIRDISDIKNAEQSSKDSQASLQAIVDNTVDGLITIDRRGCIETFNRACEVLFGYEAKNVIGKNVKVLMPEPYREEHDGYLQNYYTSGTRKVIGIGRQVEGRKKDGTVFPMDLSVSEVEVKGRTIYSGIIRDISDIQEAQLRLAAVLDNTVDGLITINEYGIIEHYNKACEVIFGFTMIETVGKNVKILMPEPYHSEHDEYLSNYHKTGVKRVIGSGREVVGLRKDGSTFPLDLSVSEVNVHGRKLYSGIVRDISVRKKTQADIKKANAELEEFAYRTSHDLRSPLISSIRMLDLVNEDLREGQTDDSLEKIALVQTSLGKLETLVKDILVLTKVRHAQEELIEVNVKQTIHEAIGKIKGMDNFERLKIDFDLSARNTLCLPKTLFALIVENLLSNAVKYQDIAKPKSYIKIKTYNISKRFILEVSDNGLGIPKKHQASLFSMFKRFHPKTSFGSGLGLYMLKNTIERLEGEIVFTDEDMDTKFIVTLPMTN
ncbi:hypothetical protein GMES_0386 [Paraglaciecola mesophila KMM 241]|uniref:Sensor protein FixL n=1 Tax=Paraglaciecola mesophila KMM 241 TaxID=1128912 RepID=K6ZH32_9ALTE|nr:PAS domain-containing sensor histidine kinase [Paraglaciecola mesophila]GAC22695.1 hypothetical protein GMES_0386 [Paraglaciecola mesophila KMM 241]|tara:strand:- start:1215 stop:3077 length:1863 start_codon:yes stop_codon:yes gene_type:complete